jgi:hypothetical protein
MKVKGRVFRSRRCLPYSVNVGFQSLCVNVRSFDRGAYFRFPATVHLGWEPILMRRFCIRSGSKRRGAVPRGPMARQIRPIDRPHAISPLSASSISTQFGSQGLGENGESFTRRSPWQIRLDLKGSNRNQSAPKSNLEKSTDEMWPTHGRQPQFG